MWPSHLEDVPEVPNTPDDAQYVFPTSDDLRNVANFWYSVAKINYTDFPAEDTLRNSWSFKTVWIWGSMKYVFKTKSVWCFPQNVTTSPDCDTLCNDLQCSFHCVTTIQSSTDQQLPDISNYSVFSVISARSLDVSIGFNCDVGRYREGNSYVQFSCLLIQVVSSWSL